MVLQILLRVSELDVMGKCFGFFIVVVVFIVLISMSTGGDNNTPKTT